MDSQAPQPGAVRIGVGSALVILGGLVLLVSLFLDWWEGPLGEGGVSAWTALEIADLALAALAIIAIVLALPSSVPPAARDGVAARWLPWLGPAALVFIAATLIDDPPTVNGLSPAVGAWIGLAGAVLLSAGALLDRAQVSLVISTRDNGDGSRAEGRETAGAEPDPDKRPG
jgi:hypothetical protein